MPIAIDIFAGAGGFGLGFQMAGFDIPFSLEKDAWACDTLRYNHPNMVVAQADITQYITTAEIQRLVSVKPDVIIGGPPCQGFSVAGPAQKDPNDPRNSLFQNFARWVDELRPKAFVMENVVGLVSRRNAEGASVIKIIQQTFEKLGYFVEIWTLNSAHFGAPQERVRVFIVGHQNKENIGEPLATHTIFTSSSQLTFDMQGLLPAITMWEAISDLPELEACEGSEEQPYKTNPLTEFQMWARSENPILYNHVAMEHTPRLVERFKHIGWGESSSDVSEQHAAHRRNGNGEISVTRYDQNNRRLNPNKPSHTIAAAFYANFLHPYQHRNLTAREGARIQSFPDSYRFRGKKTVVSHKLLQREGRVAEKYLCQYNQIGNAVPPLLARAVGNHLKEALSL